MAAFKAEIVNLNHTPLVGVFQHTIKEIRSQLEVLEMQKQKKTKTCDVQTTRWFYVSTVKQTVNSDRCLVTVAFFSSLVQTR